MVHSLCHCDSVASLAADGARAADGEAQEALLGRMEGAVTQLLLGVGEDPAREGLVDTPRVRDWPAGKWGAAAAAAAAATAAKSPAGVWFELRCAC